FEAEASPVNVRLVRERVGETARDRKVCFAHKVMSGKFSEKQFRPKRTEKARYQRNVQRRHPIDPKHVDGTGVIAEHQRTAITWPPVEALPAETDLPVRDGQAHVGF